MTTALGVFSKKTQYNMNDIKTVCVYCASSTKIDNAYFEGARALGTLLAQKGIRVVNGAGSMGLMREVTDAAIAAGGRVTGVIPQFMTEQGWAYDALTDLVVTADMHERKQRMASMSDAVVALPGGCGTMEELLEIITWKQLGLYFGPIVIFNINGFYDPLLQMLDNAIEGNFMREVHRGIWSVAHTAEEVLEQLYTTAPWSRDIRKFAAI